MRSAVEEGEGRESEGSRRDRSWTRDHDCEKAEYLGEGRGKRRRRSSAYVKGVEREGERLTHAEVNGNELRKNERAENEKPR